MNNAADILRLLHNLIRTGLIADVDHTLARARVQTGDNLTDWLPWLTLRAGTTKDWNPPTIGEQVILFSPSGDLGQGIILAGLYSVDNPQPANSADVFHRIFPDETQVTYDHVNHQLTINIKGDVSLNVDGNCTAHIGGDLTATIDGKASVTAGGDTTVDAPTIKLNGGAGVVTGAHICMYTGTPHSDCSSTVFAGK